MRRPINRKAGARDEKRPLQSQAGFAEQTRIAVPQTTFNRVSTVVVFTPRLVCFVPESTT
jgi:hypothetical protein